MTEMQYAVVAIKCDSKKISGSNEYRNVSSSSRPVALWITVAG